MTTVQPFSLEVIKTHKCFYLLRHITNATEIQLMHNTPAGHIETDVADAFSMPNGRIIVAWKLPTHVAPMHNLVAIHDTTVENVNLIPLERVIGIYGRPVDAQVGTFIFTNSDMIIAPGMDWRCDNGKYGPAPFHKGIRIIDKFSDITVYEPVLSINGVGHIIYLEGVAKQELAEDHLNNDLIPSIGRTFWETMKLIREWAIVNQPPFNNQDVVSHKAHLFIKELKFTDQELSVIDGQIPMQIANYLSGSTNARQRPDGILPITDDVKNLLFSRLASGSISAFEYMNPGMWDLGELLDFEQAHLVAEKIKFDVYLQDVEMPQTGIDIQNRFFANKKIILDKVAAGQL